MKTHKAKNLLSSTFSQYVFAFGLMAIFGMAGGCNSGGESSRSIANIGSSQIRLNEVLFFPSSGPEWIELYNPDSDSVNIGLLQISNDQGDTYDIPEELLLVPPGGYVVILFDGLGADQNDYDFEGGYALLHTDMPTNDFFNNNAGSCILYSGNPGDYGSKIDFVAWGDYSQDGRYVNNAEEYGSFGPVRAGETIGVHPDVYKTSIGTSWVIYARNEITPGKRNAIPSPVLISPFQGCGIGDDKVTFSWSDWFINIKEFHLEIDDNDDFSSPTISVITKGSLYHCDASFQDGWYYWRVKSTTENLEESLWSESNEFEIIVHTREEPWLTVDLGLHPPLLQHKDTHLLCSACPAKSPTLDKHQWDEPHTGSPTSAQNCPHCKKYCGRASVAMINRFFDGDISQDRISLMVGESILKPLGHGKGFSPLDVSIALSKVLKNGPLVEPMDITLSAIKRYIMEYRPLITARYTEKVKHLMVIDGFDLYSNPDDSMIHLIDPWTKTEKRVKLLTSGLVCIWAPPAGSKGIKEEDLSTDSDEDGITNFDEQTRFFTDPNKSDTDGDGIPDKVEIWAWAYGKGTKSRRPDNGEKIWLDSNYDNDLYEDGEEDLNKNGNVDEGECDPFVANDPVQISFKIAGATTSAPEVYINGQIENVIPTTGASAGYHGREVLFLWCGKLKPGINTFMIKPSEVFSGEAGDHPADVLDDIQVRDIKIIDQDHFNKVLLDEAGPFHIGNDNLQNIKEFSEKEKWKDPNPLGFWAELKDSLLILEFKWYGHQSQD
jgi:hypothetical protein